MRTQKGHTHSLQLNLLEDWPILPPHYRGRVASPPPSTSTGATAGAGNAKAGAGNATAGAGNATAGAGNATAGAGNATAGAGNATAGAGNATAGAGNATAPPKKASTCTKAVDYLSLTAIPRRMHRISLDLRS